jgi:hypothetical protein
MKTCNVEINFVINDEQAVIKAAKRIVKDEDWEEELNQLDDVTGSVNPDPISTALGFLIYWPETLVPLLKSNAIEIMDTSTGPTLSSNNTQPWSHFCDTLHMRR